MITVFSGIPILLIWSEEGIDILVIEEHPLNEQSPIEVTEGGIEISNKDEQFMKAFSSIESNLLGCSKIISVNEEQLLNAQYSMLFTDVGIIIFFNDLHSLKAKSPIDFTEEGIVIFSRDEHSFAK